MRSTHTHFSHVGGGKGCFQIPCERQLIITCFRSCQIHSSHNNKKKKTSITDGVALFIEWQGRKPSSTEGRSILPFSLSLSFRCRGVFYHKSAHQFSVHSIERLLFRAERETSCLLQRTRLSLKRKEINARLTGR